MSSGAVPYLERVLGDTLTAMIASRSFVLVSTLIACAASAQSVSPTPAPVAPAAFPTGASSPLGEQIANLLADPAVSRAHWGIAVTTLDGTPIYGLDEGKLFRPASTNKLFTTATAMALLGPSSTVKTVVSFQAPAADGTVTGDVTLVGYGDANLSGRTIPFVRPGTVAAGQPSADPLRYIDELAAGVAKAGVRHITGDVVASDWPWEPYPQGWGTDDLLWGYGAPVSNLVIDDNEVLLTVTPGALHEPATVTLTPDIGYYRIQSTVKTTEGGSPGGVVPHRDAGEKILHVDGLVPVGHPYVTEIAVDDPPAYAAFALRKKLEERGITADGTVRAEHEFAGDPDNFLHESKMPLPAGMTRMSATGAYPPGPRPIVVTHVSPTLAEDVMVTLKESQNLHAEMMLRRLGHAFGESTGEQYSTFAQGARVVRQWLMDAGIDGDDFTFYDGSGLSAKDVVTPRAQVQLLAYATKQAWFPLWKAALPVGGIDGTLGSRFKDSSLKGHLFAKTGTLGESRALAGYVDCASGRQVIFSIMVDDHAPGNPADHGVMDKIVAAIAAAE